MSRAGELRVSLTDLKARIESLSPMGVRFVARLIDSLSSPPRAEVARTWLASNPEWVEYFGLTISAHHGTTTEALGLTGFEVAFRNACEAVAWAVDEPGSATRRFVDAIVQVEDATQLKLSLKSTAAKSNQSPEKVLISKLTEAAWIQDARTPKDRRRNTLELFRSYRESVDAILMLRACRKSGDVIPTKYQLFEIPTAIFASLEDAPLSAFVADGPTVDCSYLGESVAAKVSLDRSDAKITIRQIKLSVCTLHVEWHMTQP